MLDRKQNNMSVFVINAGSTSLKFGLFDNLTLQPSVTGEIDWADGDRERAMLVCRPRNAAPERSRVSVPNDRAAAACALRVVVARSIPPSPITAVGHRVVHGGTDFRGSVVIDSKVKVAIARLGDLAPLHNPAALEGIEEVEAALPRVPQIAVFDTAFYSDLPPRAYVYPLPYEWHKEWGIRRFGFHGLSHAYCASRAAQLLGKDPAQLRLVSCHLGGGCSATAVRGGVAVATTMGFSPLDGLMMGTRSGSIDPGILIYLQRQHRLTLDGLDHALNYSSGLLGVSGISADLTRVVEAAAQGNERARLAFEMFTDRVRSAVGALATTLGGLDALVFTDRVGEHSALLRRSVCEGLEFIGLQLDQARNLNPPADSDVATADSRARILVVHTQEELMVAREVLCVVRGWQGAVNPLN